MSTITEKEHIDCAHSIKRMESYTMQNVYAFYLKAKQKTGLPSQFIYFSAKNDARAIRDLENFIEDADLDPKGYFKAVRTNFPVYDDLPEEGVFDPTWCARYQVDDNNDWQVIARAAKPLSTENTSTSAFPPIDEITTHFATELSQGQKIIGAHLYGSASLQISAEQLTAIDAAIADKQNVYAGNLLTGLSDIPNLQKCFPELIITVVGAVKSVWPPLKDAPAISQIANFTQEFLAAKHEDREKAVNAWKRKSVVKLVPDVATEPRAQAELEMETALHVLGVNPDDAKGADIQKAKTLIKSRDPAWRNWNTEYRCVPGIGCIPRGELWELMADGHKDLKLIEDAEARQEYVAGKLFCHPLLPDYQPAKSASKSWEKEEVVDTGTGEVQSLGKGQFTVAKLFENSSLSKLETTQETTAPETGTAEMETTTAELDTNTAILSAERTEMESAGIEITETVTSEEENTATAEEETVNVPSYFEPGRYHNIPNDVYHAANGISSTQVKDARISPMYFNARHVAKTIERERSEALTFGSLVHTLALEPKQLGTDFNIEPIIPEGAFTNTASMRAFIEAYNASLPALMNADELKEALEAYNASLPPQRATDGNVEDVGISYQCLPPEFQRIEADVKPTAAAMKACIKEFNATLQKPVKTSGSYATLLDTYETIYPNVAAQERAKPQPLNVTGKKEDLQAAVRSIRPDAIFADELLERWQNGNDKRTPVSQRQMQHAKAIQQALFTHPSAGPLLAHPNRSVEVSYFGIDEDTGLEIRVRPDLEIDMNGLRIGLDLKTVTMGRVKQDSLRTRLHREIIDRDYHLSAAMYSDVAAFDQFFWIFVNKDEGYHWVAIVEASVDLLELGRLEYKKAMRDINTGFDTGVWPAPITEEITDDLNDFDQRRMEALRLA